MLQTILRVYRCFSTCNQWLSKKTLGLLVCVAAAVLVTGVPVATGADYREARSLFFRGDYHACIAMARAEVESGIWNDVWARLLIRCYLETGQYEEAREVYESVENKFSNSIPLRVLGATAYRYCGQSDKANQLLKAIPELVRNAPWRYSDRENLLAIGKYLLSEGADPRDVLTGFYDRVLRFDAEYVDAHIAIAELAIDKADYAEAVKSLEQAVKLRPEDPYIHYLLAIAWAPSEPERAATHLEAALERNPFHAESLLMQAEQLIDGERYDAAEKVLDEIHKVNPAHPIAWALRAAIAHLRGQYAREGECRSKALEHWELNPNVDYRIGRILSRHYRFAEGVKYQRRALRMDPTFRPAQFQLAQDLLRSGRDEEGWTMVDQVAAADKYNVVAYNLSTLRRRLEQFATLEAPGLVVRMDATEARIYGPRVIELLTEARRVLSARYEFEPQAPVAVEIFDQQSDFAIRTFGLPGGIGYLGVCFGPLITANSPASQGDHPANWESVLWHEFCHVITLQKTNNRMPRWLSEGISVYEEMQRDPSWGQPMTPAYKQMLLSDAFVPLSRLSNAFLRPPSPMHLEFAYFESALAVEYLIERHGLPRLLRLLDDLGVGMTINEAFEQRFGDLDVLDREFAEFARQRATAFLPGVDFDSREVPETDDTEELYRWLHTHETNYPAWRRLATLLVSQRKWDEAQAAVDRLLELYPDDGSTGGGLELAALVARQTGDWARERELLLRLTTVSSDNVPALTRLIELDRQGGRVADLERHARKLLAVQPLIPVGHEALIEALRAQGKPELTVQPLQALLAMDPIDPAEIEFRLAEGFLAAGDPKAARRHVLYALEEAPRYRDAHRLLTAIHWELEQPPAPPAAGQDESSMPTRESPESVEAAPAPPEDSPAPPDAPAAPAEQPPAPPDEAPASQEEPPAPPQKPPSRSQ